VRRLDGGAEDGQTDRAIVEGTNDGDGIHVNGDASAVVVAGLRAVVAIRHQEATDALAVDGVDGNDDISAAGLPAQAIDLILPAGPGDEDAISVNGDARGVKVSGLAATVGILHSEVANDRLEINTLAGGDAVDSSGLAAGVIQLFVDGMPVP
jgi:hypothetical protein